jgi:hypothetical protein
VSATAMGVPARILPATASADVEAVRKLKAEHLAEIRSI